MAPSSDVETRTGRPLLIGLTGPIGCGKSTVTAMLHELGATIIDADLLAREATAPGAATLPAIRTRFGDAIFAPDGSLDRAALATVVFDDPIALAELEQIVHPHVRRMITARLREGRDEALLAVIEAIKLVEGGLAADCDEVWIVECDPETQRSRLAERGAGLDDIERRLSAQGPALADRLAGLLNEQADPAPHVRRISTEGSIEATRGRVEDALAEALAQQLF